MNTGKQSKKKNRIVVGAGVAGVRVLGVGLILWMFPIRIYGQGVTLESGDVNRMENAVKAQDCGIARTPPGPNWPVIWSYQFSEATMVKTGEPFKVTFTITPSLFDISDITFTSFVSGKGLRSLAQDVNWSGSLKKGQQKTIVFEMVASAKGFNGQYGIRVKSKSLYNELRSYIDAQKQGPYASATDKNVLQHVIDLKEKRSPIYRDSYISSVDVPKSKEE